MRRNARITLMAALALAPLLGAATAMVADGHGHGHGGEVTVKDDSEVRWAPAPASLPKGMELAVIMGDPAKPGPFALRVKLPPNTVIAPHTHATDETLTVIQGSFQHGMGETIDKTKGVQVNLGGFVYLPANMPHSLWNAGETTVLQVNGTGPFGLKYVNPKDDPSQQGK